MTTAKKIVVAVRDEQHGRIGLQRALLLLKSPQDKIHLIHVSRFESWLRVAELLTPQRLILTAEGERDPDHYAWLQQLSESPDNNGAKVEFAVIDGEPGAAIVDYAAHVQADLIILTPPRQGKMREFFLGSTALRILRTAICPVLISHVESDAPYKHAMLAIDLDIAGQHVVRTASKWLAGAQFDIAHAYRVPQEGQMRSRGAINDQEILKLRDLMRVDHEHKLEQYRNMLPEVTLHLEHGWAASVILDFVFKLKPDILVLSKHRGSNRDERIFGSVTQFLLYKCPVDIMLVP
jgi:nucleotide-binding universal stress UspA family protein